MSIFSGWSDFPFEVTTADLKKIGEDRPGGLHLSEIIRQMKIAEGENVSDIPGEQPWLRAFEGFIWESALEYMAGGATLEQAMDLSFKQHMVHQRKGLTKQIRLESDGIHMTPDAFNEFLGEIESYKYTRKKMVVDKDAFEAKYWPWLVQEKSYCRAIGVDTVRWIVLFSNGDYSKGAGSGPRCVQATMTWTAEELKENWDRVLEVAGRMK